MSRESKGGEPWPEETSIVISHANQDADLASSMADALERESLNCWLASRDVPVGSNFAEEIYRAISRADFLLVLLSPESISSPHVKREVNMAIDKGVTLLPVLLGHHSEFMGTLPDDWNYWLSLAQFVTFTDTATTVSRIAKEIRKRTGQTANIRQTPTPVEDARSSPLKQKPKLTEYAKPRPTIVEAKKTQPVVVETRKVEPRLQEPKKAAPVRVAPSQVKRKTDPKKPHVRTFTIVSAVLGTVLVAGVAFAMTQNPPTKGSQSYGVTQTKPSPVISTSAKVSPTPTPTHSAQPRVSAKAVASVKASSAAKPSPSAKPRISTTAKRSSVTNQQVSITQTLIGKLTTAATSTLKACASHDDPAPTGCPFHEKIWVHGLDFIWTLRGTPHVSSVVHSGSAFVGNVTFSVVDRIKYANADSKIRTSPQTISARAYFRAKGSKYTVTWK